MIPRWVETTETVFNAIFSEHHQELVPFETLTDIDGRFGEPKIVTVWGWKEADCGLIKSVASHPDGKGNWNEVAFYLALVKKGIEP